MQMGLRPYAKLEADYSALLSLYLKVWDWLPASACSNCSILLDWAPSVSQLTSRARLSRLSRALTLVRSTVGLMAQLVVTIGASSFKASCHLTCFLPQFQPAFAVRLTTMLLLLTDSLTAVGLWTILALYGRNPCWPFQERPFSLAALVSLCLWALVGLFLSLSCHRALWLPAEVRFEICELVRRLHLTLLFQSSSLCLLIALQVCLAVASSFVCRQQKWEVWLLPF